HHVLADGRDHQLLVRPEAGLDQVAALAVEADRALRGDEQGDPVPELDVAGRRLAAPVARLLPGARAGRDGEHAPVGDGDSDLAALLRVEHALAELEPLAGLAAAEGVD